MSSNQDDRRPGIHLVGSLPHEDAHEAFRWVGEALRDWVTRVPDGETGERAMFILSQAPLFFANAAMEEVPLDTSGHVKPLQILRLKDRQDPKVDFERLGYADAATAGYEAFCEARGAGLLALGARYLFALPSPFSTVSMYVVRESQADTLPSYEEKTVESLKEILAAVPHNDLAVQWDLPSEILMQIGFLDHPYDDYQAIFDAVVRVSDQVPDDVELGYHICWSDRNFEELPPGFEAPDSAEFERPASAPAFPTPDDATALVELANAISDGVRRPIQFLHIPTDLGWMKPSNYAPLERLRLHPETEFYVGLVHPQDGLPGARARLQAVRDVTDREIGIATPCGMGRYGNEKFAVATDALVTLAREQAG